MPGYTAVVAMIEPRSVLGDQRLRDILHLNILMPQSRNLCCNNSTGPMTHCN